MVYQEFVPYIMTMEKLEEIFYGYTFCDRGY